MVCWGMLRKTLVHLRELLETILSVAIIWMKKLIAQTAVGSYVSSMVGSLPQNDTLKGRERVENELDP